MMKKIIGFIALLLIVGGLFVWFGVYNIAATEKHWSITASLIELVRERSTYTRAYKVATPPAMDNSELIATGARHYAAMCTGCHLAPGLKVTELHQGLYPQPPVFHEPGEYAKYDPKVTFWVIKNGIKLTGMPAWGVTHSDEEIWGLVAFVKQLRGMSPDTYQHMVKAAESSESMHGNHEHEHEHSHNGH